MLPIANLGSAPAAISTLSAHLHGHKKGSHVQTAEDTAGGSDGAAQVPAGLRQTLFGSLLNSLQQVIGVQLTAPPAGAGATGSAASPAAKVAGSVLNVRA